MSDLRFSKKKSQMSFSRQQLEIKETKDSQDGEYV